MTGQIEIFSPTEMVNPNSDQQATSVKRIIAEALKARGQKEFYADSTGKNQSYADFLSVMLWDGITEGVILFADGTKMKISEAPTEWLSLVKFLASHSEGGVNQNNQFNGVNVFKIYKGVDDSRV